MKRGPQGIEQPHMTPEMREKLREIGKAFNRKTGKLTLRMNMRAKAIRQLRKK